MMLRVILCVVVGLSVVTVVRVFDRGAGRSDVASARGATSSDGGPSGDCGVVATSGCTPDVGAGGAVTVDGVTWQVARVATAEVLGRTAFAAGVRARETYLIVTLRVHSTRRRPLVLRHDTVRFVGTTSHRPDTAATLLNAGGKDDVAPGVRIEPGARREMSVVFDVSAHELATSSRLRVSAASSGSAYGLIGPWTPSAKRRLARPLQRSDRTGAW